MCTATYLPLSPGGFILTHSRDEKAIRRAAIPPRTIRIGGQQLIMPEDPQSGGTWIAASAQVSVCLLNGAFAPHQPQPPYGSGQPKHSRGLVIPHFFQYSSAATFFRDYDFRGIEPFTLLIAEVGKLTVLRWTGERVFMREKDPGKPHIWSSATLYTPEIIEKRESWFGDWCDQNPTPTVDAIREFHQTAGDGDGENSLLMNRRDTILTISLTSIVYQEDPIDGDTNQMIYEDFTQQLLHQQTLVQPYAIA
jgi:hypothetical protein